MLEITRGRGTSLEATLLPLTSDECYLEKNSTWFLQRYIFVGLYNFSFTWKAKRLCQRNVINIVIRDYNIYKNTNANEGKKTI